MHVTITTNGLEYQADVKVPPHWHYEALTDRIRFTHDQGMMFDVGITTIEWPPSKAREQFMGTNNPAEIFDAHTSLNATGITGRHLFQALYRPQTAAIAPSEDMEAMQAAWLNRAQL